MGLGVRWNYEHSAAPPQRGRRPAKFFSCEVLQLKPIADRFLVVGESISKYRFAQATAKTGIIFCNLREEAGLTSHCASWVGFPQRPLARWSLFLPPTRRRKKDEKRRVIATFYNLAVCGRLEDISEASRNRPLKEPVKGLAVRNKN